MSAAFNKAADFVVRQADPFNGGPPLERLAANVVTPNELFFVRNHGNVPQVDVSTYRLSVTGEVRQPLTFSLDELLSTFKSRTVQATMQCAGNRRQEMMALRPIPGELPWGAEAVSHAKWEGVRLSEVLRAAGVNDEDGLHVEFSGLDDVERHGKQFNFGGSIPIEEALNGEAILATKMNGETLQPVHGFPLRMVVPGYIGARSVKWLREIRVSKEPSHNYFQRHAYRLFPPDVNADNVDWEQGLMLGPMALNSAICSVGVKGGVAEVRGYAVAGGGRQIARVDVSADGGANWQPAELEGAARPGSWRLWQARVQLEAGEHEIVARAVDTAGNAQPANFETIWNFKGYAANAWQRQTILIE